MSLDTLPPPAAGFGDWDEFAAFAVLVENYDRTDLPEPDRTLPRRTHRRTRRAADEAAIDESLRDL